MTSLNVPGWETSDMDSDLPPLPGGERAGVRGLHLSG